MPAQPAARGRPEVVEGARKPIGRAGVEMGLFKGLERLEDLGEKLVVALDALGQLLDPFAQLRVLVALRASQLHEGAHG